MSGWNAQKVEAFKSAFYEFLKYVTITSKERGQVRLGDNIYRAQQMFLDGVFEGLSQDIHMFKVLKSRQLGMSTITRPLMVFWLGMHPGLRAYMVYDIASHTEEARIELSTLIHNLPAKMKFPRIKRENRLMIELDNGSIITFASAGVRSGKSSGTLGRSSGINAYHGSELCSWEAEEGYEAFKAALAEDFENRLYIEESTARGFNLWYDIWTEARNDTLHQKCIFLGWWSKDIQSIPYNHTDYLVYGAKPPSKKEEEKIKEVKLRYGWDITLEQLAWIRRKMDPSAAADCEDYSGSVFRQQEQPWTEDDAFVSTGSSFFDNEGLTNQQKTHVNKPIALHSYVHGSMFIDTKIVKPNNEKSIELRIWEKPSQEAIYILGADVAFGSNEKNDRSAIQIIRCYADGVDQVAEFASPLVNPQQFAWVIASLLGYYGVQSNTVHMIVELNGPGDTVWRELRNLKQQLNNKIYRAMPVNEGIENVFKNVRDFIDSRADAVLPGRSAWQWKTSGSRKVTIMEQIRVFTANGLLHIKSKDLLEEMRAVERDGDSIEAKGTKKDDRVIAMALAVHYWNDSVRGVRKTLLNANHTREAAIKRHAGCRIDVNNSFNSHQINSFFAKKSHEKSVSTLNKAKTAWRDWRS